MQDVDDDPGPFGYILDWFELLNEGRTFSIGMEKVLWNPVTYSELHAWACTMRISLKLHETNIIMMLDKIYLRIVNAN